MPHLQSQALPEHISATRKASFIKFSVGLWNSELVFIQGHPTTVFSEISVRRGKNCLDFSIAWGRPKISRWLFHSCTILKPYLIKSLGLSRDGFLVISFILFDPVLFIHVCFHGLIRSEWKKMYSSKGIISLWSALSFFFLRYKLNLV